MKINITFLGTGSAFSKRFGNNSAVLTVESGETTKNMMIDCGRTTPDDLSKSDFTWSDIDSIFITHLHGDHVYGLEEAGFFGRFVLNKKPHLILPHKKFKNDLWDKVLKGTMSDGDLDRKMIFEDYFTYEIVDDVDQYFFFNDCMISVYSTEHIKNKKSYGLIIGEYKYVLYTSDSLFDSNLIKFAVADGAQAVFHDCQMIDYTGKVHASLNELSTMDLDSRLITYIMHYGDDLDSYYTYIKELGLKIVIPRTKYTFEIGG